MASLRHAVILGLLLGPAPAFAQSPAPGAAPTVAPTGPIVGGRRVTATGQTKPPPPAATGMPRPVNEAEMIKAQKAAEARSKAWDSRMRNTMGSICHGC
ncbi:hypothetical protein SAMN05216360_108133 [Methylobacterium phyllostachyos]|uniref:Uncharacterized protein n=1 Tax=Methylobacterium phyllostachyos TaxID=582672 RepID=A0A1H0BD71_9HYPH|nr:hypothetical protein [Methylobacterium phyllostachyos]SDN43576.1 hypothetical protein SAMN05216360_108133 [Methylobacterium phyllostachyos]